MRSTFLILGSIAVIGLAYFIYWCFEPSPPAVTNRGGNPNATLPPAPKVEDHSPGYGPGHAPWMEQYDEKTGALSSRFRADEYVPRKNGMVQVKNPTCEFYLGAHQHLEVVGTDGEFVVKDVPAIGKTTVGKTGMPNRGRLNDVVMKLIDDEPSAGKDPVVLTLMTNNIAFDNESFRITTESYTDADGTLVQSDRVPVHMVGDYEFDGRGLTLRWNDRDGRLELLEIAHGERLVIKHPGTGAIGPAAPAHDPSKSTGAPVAREPARVPPGGSAVISVLQTSAPTTAPASEEKKGKEGAGATIYAATFYDNVKVRQGEPVEMTADSMRVTFRLKQADIDAAHGPATAPAAHLPPTSQPATTRPPLATTASATTHPSTQPAEVPVVVNWTGKLRIVPTNTPPCPIATGEMAVELFGTHAPVFARRAGTAHQEGMEVRSASLLYQTSDGSAALHGSEAFPQVRMLRLAPMSSPDQRPSVVTSESIDYSAANRVALLHGAGEASFPLFATTRPTRPNGPAATTRPAAPATTHPAMLEARWKREGRLAFVGRRDEMSIDHASFAGDVDVRHPQLALQSQTLDLSFAAPAVTSTTRPTTRPAEKAPPDLKQVTAGGDVHCVLTDAAGRRQSIECPKLEVATGRSPDGKVYPQRLHAFAEDATAEVHAFDESQDLRAGDVDLMMQPSAKATMRPTTGPSEPSQLDTAAIELQKMTALRNVRVAGRDGSHASADELYVTMEHESPKVMLTGPALARVWDARKNEVSGPRITLDARSGEAHVVGPGTLHMVDLDDDARATAAAATKPVAATKPARERDGPIDVIWSDHADIDGAGNRIDVYGKVISRSPDAEGAMNVSQCEHVHIDLQKKPAPPSTRPATRPAAIAKGGDNSPLQMDLFKDKEAALITLDRNAVVSSTLSDASGNVLRQFELKAPKILYALQATPDLPAHSLLVPSAGEMLVRDHRAADPTTKKADAADGMASGRGATAFRWSKKLLYSEATRRADMTGDVLVVHRGDTAADEPARITAEQMSAFFQPAALPAPGATTQVAASGAQQPRAMELKWLSASGSVFVTRATTELTAARIDLDPISHWLHAYGTERNPAVFSNTASNGSTSALQVDWNTQTWNVKFPHGVSSQGQR